MNDYIETDNCGYWTALLEMLEDRYNGMAALLGHEYNPPSGDVIEYSSSWNPETIKMYPDYARGLPWARFMWAEDEGYVIVGERRYVREMQQNEAEHIRFQEEFLIKENLRYARGLGAILWKDKMPGPQSCVVIGVLRPLDRGSFSDLDIAEFEAIVPEMRKRIKRHRWVSERMNDKLSRE
jgi:hypothetical protein